MMGEALNAVINEIKVRFFYISIIFFFFFQLEPKYKINLV